MTSFISLKHIHKRKHTINYPKLSQPSLMRFFNKKLGFQFILDHINRSLKTVTTDLNIHEFNNSISSFQNSHKQQPSHTTFYFHAYSSRTNNINKSNHQVDPITQPNSFYHLKNQLQQQQQQ